MPRVSVVMPVYNSQKYLAEAIDSILAQTFGDFELLCVDDGSSDNSAAIIQSYAQRDSRVKLIQHEQNQGQAAAQNTGLAHARGAYFTLMDADDISLPQRLERQRRFLDCHAEIGAVGACCTVMNHDMSEKLSDFALPLDHALIALNLFIGAGFVGATVMARAEHLKAVGGWDSGRRHAPDLVMSMRLLMQTGIRFANLPDRLFLYRRHEQAKTVAELAISRATVRQIRTGMLERLWGEAPASALDRFEQLRRQESMSWAQRRQAKGHLRRLIDSLLSQGLVDPADSARLLAAVNRRLEAESPPLWQKFRHWSRYRLPWLFADAPGPHD